MNSRAKGATGERELASKLRSLGYENVRRTVQYCGKTGDAADLVGLPGIHIECKRVERLNLDDAMAQARGECGKKKPAVMHRKDRGKWRVTMDLEDWIELYCEWEAGTGTE